MPGEVQNLYSSLQQELIWTHAKWKVFRQLFAVDQQRLDILNSSAPFFFRVAQQTLFEDTLLAISRLTDPSRTVSKENRSLRMLVEQLQELVPTDLLDDLKEDLAAIKAACTPFRDWRNRRLAHSDLDTSLKVTDEPLPGVSRADIEKALACMRELMNRVSGHFEDSETLYAEFQTWSGGTRLVNLLELGLAHEKAEREDIQEKIQRLKDNT